MASEQDKPHHLGHRTRLRRRLIEQGAASLADHEILEALLFGAQPLGDTKPLAKALIKRFGSLAGALSASPHELAEVPGLGEASIALVKTVPEAARRLALTEISE